MSSYRQSCCLGHQQNLKQIYETVTLQMVLINEDEQLWALKFPRAPVELTQNLRGGDFKDGADK